MELRRLCLFRQRPKKCCAQRRSAFKGNCRTASQKKGRMTFLQGAQIGRLLYETRLRSLFPLRGDQSSIVGFKATNQFLEIWKHLKNQYERHHDGDVKPRGRARSERDGEARRFLSKTKQRNELLPSAMVASTALQSAPGASGSLRGCGTSTILDGWFVEVAT